MPNFNPVSAVVDSVSKGVETVAGVFTTNKEKDAQRSAEEQMALLQAYQAEFNQRQNRNWVDSFADGFNRLIRPLIVTLIIFIFVIAYISPSHMAEITLAMSSIPEGYWTLLSVIIAFYFGGRMQLKSQQFRFTQTQSEAVKALIETRKEFRKLETDNDEPDKVVGDKLGKDPLIDSNRPTKINMVIEKASDITTENEASETDKKAALAKVIDQMNSESPEATRKRRKFGSRRFK